MSRPASHLHAIFYALAGFFCWTCGDMFLKLANLMGLPKYEIMIVGGLGGMLSISLFLALRGELKKLRPKRFGGLAALGVLIFFNYICWQYALSYLPLANFYTILFLAPAMVAVLAALFLREKLDWRKSAAIAAGFAGVVISVNPALLLEGRISWIGYAAAFSGMLILSTQQIGMRLMGARESHECVAFYPRSAVILAGLIGIAIWGYEPMPWQGFVYALASGVVGGFGWLPMARAYKLAPAATVSPFHYSQIVTGALVGYLVWHNVPDLHLVAGAVVIIASGLYIIEHVRRAALAEKSPV